MKIALYPGSFDPITNGHIDVLKRALSIFDKVIILIAVNPNKESRFTVEERVQMIKDATKDLKGVEIDYTNGLTVDYAHKVGTNFLVRGLRNETDYKYETALSDEYHKIDSSIQMIFFLANEENASISSSKIQKLFLEKKDISKYVPDSVVKMYEKR